VRTTSDRRAYLRCNGGVRAAAGCAQRRRGAPPVPRCPQPPLVGLHRIAQPAEMARWTSTQTYRGCRSTPRASSPTPRRSPVGTASCCAGCIAAGPSNGSHQRSMASRSPRRRHRHKTPLSGTGGRWSPQRAGCRTGSSPPSRLLLSSACRSWAAGPRTSSCSPVGRPVPAARVSARSRTGWQCRRYAWAASASHPGAHRHPAGATCQPPGSPGGSGPSGTAAALAIAGAPTGHDGPAAR